MKKIAFSLIVICYLLFTIAIEYSYAETKENRTIKGVEAMLKAKSEDALCWHLSSTSLSSELGTKIREELLSRHPEIPNDVRSRIKAGKIWIGMESKYALLVRGKPEDVNRTTTAYGSSEQWVYDGYPNKLYLYFDNDKLTSWQD